MAVTYGDLIDEVIHNLQGYSAKTDALASLTADVDATATAIQIDNADGFSKGTIQIDEELIFVQRVDATSNALVIPAWGRGFRGSTPAAHTSGSMVTMSPTWPRATVAKKINEAVRELYPVLYSVRTTSFLFEPTEHLYQLPGDCLRVLDVRVRWPNSGAERSWERVRLWDSLYGQDVTDFAYGNALEINEALPAGAGVWVTYAAEPTTMTNATDAFAVTTGMSESVAALVVLGATVKLLPNMDASRLPVQSVPADALDGPNPMGSASQVAQTFYRLYLQRLEQEKKALDDRFPPRYRRMR